MRRLIRRFGSWLVRWADHGAKLHICTGHPRDMPIAAGVTYAAPHEDRYWGLSPEPAERTMFIELRRGDFCPYCGERA